jgi:hypothetical protein
MVSCRSVQVRLGVGQDHPHITMQMLAQEVLRQQKSSTTTLTLTLTTAKVRVTVRAKVKARTLPQAQALQPLQTMGQRRRRRRREPSGPSCQTTSCCLTQTKTMTTRSGWMRSETSVAVTRLKSLEQTLPRTRQQHPKATLLRAQTPQRVRRRQSRQRQRSTTKRGDSAPRPQVTLCSTVQRACPHCASTAKGVPPLPFSA